MSRAGWLIALALIGGAEQGCAPGGSESAKGTGPEASAAQPGLQEPSPPSSNSRLVPIEGTSVRILRPEGFAAPLGATGLYNRELDARIHVEELDRSKEASIAEIEEEERTDLGVRILARSDLLQDGWSATRLDLRLALDGELFRRLVLVLGDAQQSVVLACTCPEQRGDELAPLFKTILESAVWERGRVIDPFAGQVFSFEVPSGFELLGRAPDRVVFRGGADEPTYSDPRIVAEALPGGVDLDDLAAEKVRRLGFLRAIELTGCTGFSSPAGEGTRWTYRALVKGEETAVAVILFAIPSQEDTLVLLASAGLQSDADLLVELERCGESLSRTR